MEEDGVGGHVARTGEMRNAWSIFVGTPEGNTTWETYE
jgi:hypothetical protein